MEGGKEGRREGRREEGREGGRVLPVISQQDVFPHFPIYSSQAVEQGTKGPSEGVAGRT